MKPLHLLVGVFVLPALAATFPPALTKALVLDRAALAQGEWWRLWTGHWVHFSASHLAWNLAVVLIAGGWLERVRPGRVVRFTVSAAPVISATVLFCEPHLASYGGLSGLATGIAALLALTELERSRRDAAFWSIFLLLIAVKSLLDTTSVVPLFSRFSDAGVHASTAAHLAGLGVALLIATPALVTAWRQRKITSPTWRSSRPNRRCPLRERVAPACDPACRES